MPLTILVNMLGANVTIVEEHSRVWTISSVAADPAELKFLLLKPAQKLPDRADCVIATNHNSKIETCVFHIGF